MTTLPDGFATKTMSSTCIVWVGATNSRGYGLVTVDGKAVLAHRVAYEAARGPIPAGMVIDHLCRVRNCVKPEHLEPVTIAENNRRGRAAKALSVGDTCINGHRIETADELYQRPAPGTAPECRRCRTQSNHRKGGRLRASAQLRATDVLTAMAAVERAS